MHWTGTSNIKAEFEVWGADSQILHIFIINELLYKPKKNDQADNPTAVSEGWIVGNGTNRKNFRAAFEFGRHEWFALRR